MGLKKIFKWWWEETKYLLKNEEGFFLTALALTSIFLGTAATAISSYQQAQARASTANMNRLIMEGNAKLTTQRMGIEKTLTDVEIQRHRDRTRRILGGQRAQYGKAGVVGGEGTALIVATETAADAELDAMAIELAGDIGQSRLLAERAGYKQEAGLQSMMGRQAKIEGGFGVGKSVLTGISQFAQVGVMAGASKKPVTGTG